MDRQSQNEPSWGGGGGTVLRLREMQPSAFSPPTVPLISIHSLPLELDHRVSKQISDINDSWMLVDQQPPDVGPTVTRRRRLDGRCGAPHLSLSTCGGLSGPWPTPRCRSTEIKQSPCEMSSWRMPFWNSTPPCSHRPALLSCPHVVPTWSLPLTPNS